MNTWEKNTVDVVDICNTVLLLLSFLVVVMQYISPLSAMLLTFRWWQLQIVDYSC